MGTLDGRVAVVTGATKGIGRAVSEALLAEGASVALGARTERDVQEAEEELSQLHPGRVLGVPCDVRDPVACAALMDQAVDRFGALHILVNNAGVGRFAPVSELSIEDWDLLISTNLSGVFYCSRSASPHLIASGSGFIVNVGSLAGKNPFPGGAGYNASKFGLTGLSEAMMLDLRHQNVRVMLVMPGSVSTEFRGPGVRDDRHEWALQADDVARAVLHLVTYPEHALASKIEMRPSRPPKR